MDYDGEARSFHDSRRKGLLSSLGLLVALFKSRKDFLVSDELSMELPNNSSLRVFYFEVVMGELGDIDLRCCRKKR